VESPARDRAFDPGYPSRLGNRYAAAGGGGAGVGRGYREGVPPAPEPLVIGHRGASGYRPEHTRAAYELAIAQGADLVEPDLVATRDGVLVVRHENEISGTTDVADREEFAARRVTKRVDGRSVSGWFTEDFTWAELSRLRARERLPALRPDSARFDGAEGILRLVDLLALIDAAGSAPAGRAAGAEPLGLVAELKHSTYFASVGLPLEPLLAAALREAGWGDGGARLVTESFERSSLARAREAGVGGRFVYLLEAEGAPYDEVARLGRRAPAYAESLTEAGLAGLAAGTGGAAVDGVSLDKRLLLSPARREGDGGGPELVRRVHAAGLACFAWTLRPENRFLTPAHRRGREPGARGDWPTEWRAVFDTGVDAVFVDHPDLAIALRDGPVAA